MGTEKLGSQRPPQYIMEFKIADDGTWFDQHRLGELVRCGDCIHRYNKVDDCPIIWHKSDDDFCSWGDKK